MLWCTTQGWASTTLPPLDGPPPSTGMQPLLDVLLQHVPAPRACPDEAFAMCVAMIERDPFVGMIATGGCGSKRGIAAACVLWGLAVFSTLNQPRQQSPHSCQ